MEELKKLLEMGIINIDKPSGPTSFSVTDFVRKSLGVKKCSHMGTLDPKVTGVLPITISRACKLARFFIRHNKSYVGILHCHKKQETKKIQKIIDENFTGKIEQIPPHKSSVKRAKRTREVYYWKIIEESENKKDFLFECHVEGGTYIRKLCSDLGEKIGGAHMAQLRRTKAGIFGEESSIRLNDFEEAVKKWKSGEEGPLKKMIVPAEESIKKILKTANVDKRALLSLYNGKPLFKNDLSEEPKLELGEDFALFCGKIFVGTYKKTSEEKVFARPTFVYN